LLLWFAVAVLKVLASEAAATQANHDVTAVLAACCFGDAPPQPLLASIIVRATREACQQQTW
jgi:hypothetical protein